jgi:hypothetical protein
MIDYKGIQRRHDEEVEGEESDDCAEHRSIASAGCRQGQDDQQIDNGDIGNAWIEVKLHDQTGDQPGSGTGQQRVEQIVFPGRDMVVFERQNRFERVHSHACFLLFRTGCQAGQRRKPGSGRWRPPHPQSIS